MTTPLETVAAGATQEPRKPTGSLASTLAYAVKPPLSAGEGLMAGLSQSALDQISADPYGYLTKVSSLMEWFGGRLTMSPDIAAGRLEAFREIERRNPDPFSIAMKEAALATIRNQGGGRKSTFVVGPRGIEGPLSNAILGGGTSMLGS